MDRKKKGSKRRKPTDATMRNVRASSRRVAALSLQLRGLEIVVKAFAKEWAGLEQRIVTIEDWITRQQADAGVPDEQRGFQK